MRGWITTALVTLAVAGVPGCGTDSPALDRQWEADWKFFQLGQQWVRGVDLSSQKSLRVDRAGLQFRSRILNTAKDDTDLAITGQGLQLRFTIPARRYLDVATDQLPPGLYEIEEAEALILGEPRLVGKEHQPRVFVLVVVDTLRADAVNPKNTPRILEFFNGSRRYPDVSANSPWTLPSMASMFTSRPVLDLTTPAGDLVGIPDGMETWADTLRRAGFSGGAVVANSTVHVQNGFAKGFDTFLVPSIIPVKGGGPDASWAIRKAARWLAAHEGENSFLYLHLMDPHEPYRDHENGREPPKLFELAHRIRTALPEETETIRNLYDGEVRHVDRMLAPFLESLPENAVVVFTSDHGEMLGENGCWGHGLTLYEPVIRVPLLIRAPSLKGGVDSKPAQLLDLAPTVLDLLAEQIPTEMEGRSLLQAHPRRAIVAATFSAGPMRWMWRRDETKVVFRTVDQPAIIESSRRALEEADPLPGGIFCYDVVKDPDEQSPHALPADLLAPVARDFALSAGSMVPGLQVFSVGVTGGTTFELEYPGQRIIQQIWSIGPVEASWDGPLLRVEDPHAGPFSLVTIGAGGEVGNAKPGLTNLPWQHLSEAGEYPHAGLNTDQTFQPPGSYVWWNPDRTLVVGHHDETLQKLRALGYIK